MSGSYTLAPLFAVRSAGVPFGVLERLGTPAVSTAARRVNELAMAIDDAAEHALARLRTELADSPKVRSKLAPKLLRRSPLSAEIVSAYPWLAPYRDALASHAATLAELEATIDREYAALLAVLAQEASRELPDFLLLESAALLDELRALGSHKARNDRRWARTFALYLQRVCAKSDTFSRFGPIVWGTIEPGDGFVVHARPGMVRRVALETWVAARLVEILGDDPDVRSQVAPRLHPHGRLEPGMFVRLDEPCEVALSEAEHALASACDGVRSARELGDASVLASLADRGVIVWKLERYARDTAPLASLLADLDGWSDRGVAERVRACLAPLLVLVERFAADDDFATRRAIMGEMSAELERIGVVERARTRALYEAANPINENCTLASTVAIGAGASDRLIADAWPWLELWRDSITLAASRIYARVAELAATAPRRAGRLAYSSLLHAARSRGFDLDRDGGPTAIARATWAEIRRDFLAQLSSRPDAPVWQLTADDCTFLRRRHDLPAGSELALPSLDLLPLAVSAADAAAGRFEWVIGESHHAFALLQHATYWSCPDKPALHRVIRASIENGTMLSRDSGNALPTHVNPEAMLAAGSTYVGSGRPKRGWSVVRPADAEVVIDEERRDIRLRSPSGTDLGSLVHTTSAAMGMHPFFPLARPPHEPRLRLGNVIVQRRSWYVESTELGAQRTAGVSAAFVTALERARADRDIVRWVFVRPRPDVLDSSAARRDKDTKPICVDLESLVSLDILERRLRRYGAMVLTEMLPAPHQLFSNRTMFEVRTNVIPR